jgi:two-component system sensor histidine kinase UhpB
VIQAGRKQRRGSVRIVRTTWKRAAGAVGEAFDRLPLFWGILVINSSILIVATVLLALTPATVSYPIGAEQAIILGITLGCMVALNGAALRAGMRPLLSMLRQLDDVHLYPTAPHIPETGGAETRAIARAVNTTLDRLESERRASSRRVLAALEGERRRVGYELHDEIGQRLTGILLELSPLIAAAPHDLRPRLADIQEDARATLAEVGQLAWQLRPSVLDDLGLVASLEALIEGVEEHSSIDLHRSLASDVPPLEPEVELAVFRIGQEAFTNAIRHANATRIDVELENTKGLRLRVSDNGQGLSVPEQSGPGIQGMRERASLAGGSLQIDSPGELGGVTVELHLARQAL